jgi:uncharacterized spore protein YtfJ
MDMPGRKSVDLIAETARETLTVRRVFGEAYTQGEVTVIPVAKVMGGSGMGFGAGYRQDDQSPEGEGGGGGFGVRAKPVGVYVVKGEHVSWQPTVDVNRLALGGQLVGALALVAFIVTRRRR